MSIYTNKINDFIHELENEIMEINQDIKRLETEKKVYEKILTDLRELKSID